MRGSVGLAVVLAMLAPSHAFAGACAMQGLETVPLTSAGTELAKGGGVVVTTEDSAKAPKWEFVSGDRHGATVHPIGAGLVAYEPPGAGVWTLRNAAGKDVVTAIKRADAETKPLAAPRIRSLQRGESRGRRGTSVTTVVEVSGMPPESAVAIVILDGKGTVRSWAAVRLSAPDPGDKVSAFEVFQSGSCRISPTGTVDSVVGDKVSVAWLDASGRLSALARATVTKNRS